MNASKTRWAALVAAMLLGPAARAADLFDAEEATRLGLSGAPLGAAAGNVPVTALRDAEVSLRELGTLLDDRGFADRVARRVWSSGADRDHRRVALRLGQRGEEAGAEARPYRRSLAEVRARHDLSAAQAVREAERVLGAIRAGSLLADEELVVESTSHESVAFGRASDDDRESRVEEDLPLRTMVIARRHLGGVPVLGAGGELRVVFDSDGTLTGLDLPASRYTPPEEERASAGALRRRAARARRVDMQALFRAAGYSRAPAGPRERLERRGREVTVDAVRCGYYDDGLSASLRVGCLADWRDDSGADTEFVSADAAARPQGVDPTPLAPASDTP